MQLGVRFMTLFLAHDMHIYIELSDFYGIQYAAPCLFRHAHEDAKVFIFSAPSLCQCSTQSLFCLYCPADLVPAPAWSDRRWTPCRTLSLH